MSATTDSRRIDIDLRDDLEQPVPEGGPTRASLEISYSDGGGKTVAIDYGQEEWILEFSAEGRCVDRDPPTRPMPGWISDAVELVKGELRRDQC